MTIFNSIKYKDIEIPLLILIYENGGKIYSLEAKECYEPLADYFKLSEEDRSIINESENRNLWENWVRWARNELAKKSLIDKSSKRGIWKLTEKGIRKAQEESEQLIRIVVENEELRTFNNFHDIDETFIDYIEGKMVKVNVNRFERDRKARQAAIQIHGLKCEVCEFDYEDEYGEIGSNFIHIHHIIPLNQIRQNYIVNPESDLIPLCANCHAMIHRTTPALSVEELKQIRNGRNPQ